MHGWPLAGGDERQGKLKLSGGSPTSHRCSPTVQANEAVDQAFEELVLKILDTPSLLAGTTSTFGLKTKQPAQAASSCCG